MISDEQLFEIEVRAHRESFDGWKTMLDLVAEVRALRKIKDAAKIVAGDFDIQCEDTVDGIVDNLAQLITDYERSEPTE